MEKYWKWVLVAYLTVVLGGFRSSILGGCICICYFKVILDFQSSIHLLRWLWIRDERFVWINCWNMKLLVIIRFFLLQWKYWVLVEFIQCNTPQEMKHWAFPLILCHGIHFVERIRILSNISLLPNRALSCCFGLSIWYFFSLLIF